MSNYMFLPKGPCKVPLLSTEEGWKFEIGLSVISSYPHIERMWVYALYQKEDMGIVSEYIQSCFKQPVNPLWIQIAIDDFKSKHVPIPIEKYSLDMAPLYAHPQNGLSIPIPNYCCIISREDEKKLLDIIVSQPDSNSMLRMRTWFMVYRSKYALDYPKCKGNADSYLVDAFLEQHGISPYKVSHSYYVGNNVPTTATNNQSSAGNSDATHTTNDRRGCITATLIIIGLPTVLVSFLLWMAYSENDIISMIGMVGIAMLFAAFINKLRSQQ